MVESQVTPLLFEQNAKAANGSLMPITGTVETKIALNANPIQALVVENLVEPLLSVPHLLQHIKDSVVIFFDDVAYVVKGKVDYSQAEILGTAKQIGSTYYYDPGFPSAHGYSSTSTEHSHEHYDYSPSPSSAEATDPTPLSGQSVIPHQLATDSTAMPSQSIRAVMPVSFTSPSSASSQNLAEILPDSTPPPSEVVSESTLPNSSSSPGSSSSYTSNPPREIPASNAENDIISLPDRRDLITLMPIRWREIIGHSGISVSGTALILNISLNI